jgi:uncharacterized membrane protein (UPF0127 family)
LKKHATNPLPAIVLAVAATALVCVIYLLFIQPGQTPSVLPPTLANLTNRAVITTPNGQALQCTLALTQVQRETGLMYQTQLCPSCCMLFVFGSPGVYGFWMKNTLIPLDIVYLDSNLTVVDSWLDAQPCPPGYDCPVFYPKAPASFVVEVNAGTALKTGMKPGSTLNVLAG